MTVSHESSPEPAQTRPLMLASYGVDRGATDAMVEWNDIAAQLASARNYWICTTRPRSGPHVAPVWGLWLEDAFYFSTDPISRKGRNLAANSACVVHLESGDDAVIVEGVAERVTDPEVIARFVDEYDAKYSFRPDPANPGHGFYRVRPVVAFAWQERDFPGSATRWRFPA